MNQHTHPTFLIVLSDYTFGRGCRGYNIYWFLIKYFDSASIKLITLQQLLNSKEISAEHVFIGIPSKICEKHLEKINYRYLYLFDYQCRPDPTWEYTDKSLLLPLAARYFKTYHLTNRYYDMKMGLLPPRRHPILQAMIYYQKILGELNKPKKSRKIDVSFVGAITGIDKEYKSVRFNWLKDLKNVAHNFVFEGGATVKNSNKLKLEKMIPEIKDYYYKKNRLNFISYYNLMRNSKAVLIPPGNAPWTYRHYEAIYSGAVPIVYDYEPVETLIPFPKMNMINVKSDENILESVGRALQFYEMNPRSCVENILFLEQYLHFGSYDQSKKRLIDRFIEQLG